MEKQLLFDGHKIHYKTEGSGPALVLLHGFLENLHIWDDFLNVLSKTNTVISIDLPGFGKTDRFAAVHPMSLMADTVNAVLEAEHIHHCLLCGHSMGGYVSLAFAEKYGDKLKSLVLFHSHAAADNEQGKENRNRTIEIVKKNHKDFIAGFIPLLFAEENVTKFKDQIERLRSVAVKTSAESVIAALAGMRDRPDARDLLKRLKMPVLFIIGKKDSRIALETIMPQVTLPKHSEILILEEVGHMGFIEARKETLRTLAHFGIKWF